MSSLASTLFGSAATIWSQVSTMMRRFRGKSWRFWVAAGVIAMAGISVIEVEPPAHLRGVMEVHGRIAGCEFQNISGGDFFMGVTVDVPETPLLRFNVPRSQRADHEALCARNPEVRIRYHAVKRVFGPVRFWITSITEVRQGHHAHGEHG